MAYFVTGATGFVGRHLVDELLDHRAGTIHVLVGDPSLPRLEYLVGRSGDRLQPVVGDLARADPGVDSDWLAEHAGTIDHFFHVAAIDDRTAEEEANLAATRQALALAERLRAGCFHHLSSVAVAGDFRGRFDESMFDEGQALSSSYDRLRHDSERIVRDEAAVPWRVYRPSIVVGDSLTGAIDEVDGPYHLFPAIKALSRLPSWLLLMAVDLGETNLVPVDYVAKATDHLAHLPDRDGEAFHLVDPEPQPLTEVVNAFGTAAGAPRLVTPGDHPLTARAAGLVPDRLRPRGLVAGILRAGPAHRALAQTLGRLGIPAEALGRISFSARFDSRGTEHALAGSGIAVPDLESYATRLWTYWAEHVDPAARDATAPAAPDEQGA